MPLQDSLVRMSIPVAHRTGPNTEDQPDLPTDIEDKHCGLKI